MITARHPWLRRGLAGFGLAAPLSLAPVLDVTLVRASEAVLTEDQMAGVVEIKDVQADGNAVTGNVVNRTNDTLRNLRVKISDVFRRTDERKPGSHDPSQAGEARIAGPVPPHTAVPFRYERPASLPERKDGTFKTDVAVVSVTRYPAAAVPGAPEAPAAPGTIAPPRPYVPPAE